MYSWKAVEEIERRLMGRLGFPNSITLKSAFDQFARELHLLFSQSALGDTTGTLCGTAVLRAVETISLEQSSGKIPTVRLFEILSTISDGSPDIRGSIWRHKVRGSSYVVTRDYVADNSGTPKFLLEGNILRGFEYLVTGEAWVSSADSFNDSTWCTPVDDGSGQPPFSAGRAFRAYGRPYYNVTRDYELQSSTPVYAGMLLRGYVCRETNKAWIRPVSEFTDGRFEQLDISQ